VRISVLDVFESLSKEKLIADAHAHTLEYGFKMQLRLDGSTNIDGELA
jgi:hypothetical protein